MFLRTFTALAVMAAVGYGLGYRSGYEAAVTDRAIRDLGRSIIEAIGAMANDDSAGDVEAAA